MSRVRLGVPGLDEMFHGGVPRGSIILVCGGPGVGKTIMTLQYTKNAVEQEEPVVYISLEEPMDKKAENAKAFGWEVKAWEEKGLLEVMDLYMVPHSQGLVEPIDRRRGKIQFSIENELETLVKRSKAKHVVLDPLTSILIHESRSGRKRFMVSQLFQTIRDLGCTSLITSEGIPGEGDFYMEQFLADGVILLEKNLQDYRLIKTLRIDKMRGIDFDDQPRRYVISSKGMQVFNKEAVLV